MSSQLASARHETTSRIKHSAPPRCPQQHHTVHCRHPSPPTCMRIMAQCLRLPLPSLRIDSVARLNRPSTSASSCMHSSSSGAAAGALPCCPPVQQAHSRPTVCGDRSGK